MYGDRSGDVDVGATASFYVSARNFSDRWRYRQ